MITYEELREIKNNNIYNVYPLHLEFLGDTITPVSLFKEIKNLYKEAHLYESVVNGNSFGRYSFITLNPKEKIEVNQGVISITNLKTDNVSYLFEENIMEYLNKLTTKYKTMTIPGLPEFTGGYSGYFSFDSIKYIEEKINELAEKPSFTSVPEIYLLNVDEVIAFDHLKHKIILMKNIFFDQSLSDTDLLSEYERIKEELLALENTIKNNKLDELRETPLIFNPRNKKPTIEEMLSSWDQSMEEYLEKVYMAKEEIKKGNIFQVVLSRRLTITNPPDSFNVYRTMRSINPSPYMYYLQSEKFEICGASPETLVDITGNKCQTKPIAGTKRRGLDLEEDKTIEDILLNDAKEKAEHTMLLDLGRNDLGKICKFGTVKTTSFMKIEKFSKVMHLVSNVEGELDNTTPIEAICALMPAGTLSGAPKVSALKIIHQLEKENRGPYGGTLGFISYSGDVKSAITIRSCVFENNEAYLQGGAGIVADSDPTSEYNECAQKIEGVLDSVRKAYEL